MLELSISHPRSVRQTAVSGRAPVEVGNLRRSQAAAERRQVEPLTRAMGGQ
jgi:hypothetical protein